MAAAVDVELLAEESSGLLSGGEAGLPGAALACTADEGEDSLLNDDWLLPAALRPEDTADLSTGFVQCIAAEAWATRGNECPAG